MTVNAQTEWVDYAFNPWIGCTKVAAGCKHCYAEWYANRYRKAIWGPNGTRAKTSNTYWKQPLRWNREAKLKHAASRFHSRIGETIKPRVLCASLADVFENWQGPITDHLGMPIRQHSNSDNRFRTTGACNTDIYRPLTMADLRRDMFALIDKTPYLDWLLLTKFPENIRRMWPNYYDHKDYMPKEKYRGNVWLLTSVSTQSEADRNLPKLLGCRDLVPMLGLVCEPLLGPIWLRFGINDRPRGTAIKLIDWVVAGGEIGPHARPTHPDWVRSLRNQCQTPGIPFFFKQWGEWAPIHQPPGGPADTSLNAKDRRYGEWHKINEPFAEGCLCGAGHGTVGRVGKKAAGRLLAGREWNEVPGNLTAGHQ